VDPQRHGITGVIGRLTQLGCHSRAPLEYSRTALEWHDP